MERRKYTIFRRKAIKDQTVNILDFEGHTISGTITQICYCREKTGVDIT